MFSLPAHPVPAHSGGTISMHGNPLYSDSNLIDSCIDMNALIVYNFLRNRIFLLPVFLRNLYKSRMTIQSESFGEGGIIDAFTR